MDKHSSSRKQRNYRIRCIGSLIVLASFAARTPTLPGVTLSRNEAIKIGKRIWRNECNGTITGLTAWNEGENFASLGIGHFIWYPKGQRGPFEESFPKLVSFISSRGAKLPTLLLRIDETPCPWNSRAEFLHAQHTPAVNQLRRILADTVDLHTESLIPRLQSALPNLRVEAVPSQLAH